MLRMVLKIKKTICEEMEKLEIAIVKNAREHPKGSKWVVENEHTRGEYLEKAGSKHINSLELFLRTESGK